MENQEGLDGIKTIGCDVSVVATVNWTCPNCKTNNTLSIGISPYEPLVPSGDSTICEWESCENCSATVNLLI